MHEQTFPEYLNMMLDGIPISRLEQVVTVYDRWQESKVNYPIVEWRQDTPTRYVCLDVLFHNVLFIEKRGEFEWVTAFKSKLGTFELSMSSLTNAKELVQTISNNIIQLRMAEDDRSLAN